ncbi:DUF4279 domain-containing protein [Sinorhizobium garamanticum]|uniref:DUF4279 domain-containing protein n=1 Tax=Sinorhizobium garamanticum TaxID=680247 RepID=A0ABY8DAE7_9HYPH|nr:DUF4279 domain-containing protein [Sinorhizobium garamanticum]WEX87861.1 DUF4279 domain-containing protein [Sinorhizobium garamanticum]
MAEVHRTAASLRFYGDDLDPEEISRTLGAQPTKCAKKGGIWVTPNGKEIVARHGFWHLSATEESPGDLDKQVGALFSALSNDLDAWRALAARFRGNIFVGLFLYGCNEGLGLSPATTSAIGLRGLELDLDIYSGDDTDQEIV